MKLKNKIIGLLLVFCLVAGLMPTAAFAAGTGKAIQLGTDALNESVNDKNAATVYFGKNNEDAPGAWRVIGYNGEGVASAQENMTLLAAGNMGRVKFDIDETSNVYADSDLKTAVDALAGKLTEKETAAVNKRTLVSGSYNEEYTDCVSGAQVDNAVFWPLSTKEKEQYVAFKSERYLEKIRCECPEIDSDLKASDIVRIDVSRYSNMRDINGEIMRQITDALYEQIVE